MADLEKEVAQLKADLAVATTKIEEVETALNEFKAAAAAKLDEIASGVKAALESNSQNSLSVAPAPVEPPKVSDKTAKVEYKDRAGKTHKSEFGLLVPFVNLEGVTYTSEEALGNKEVMEKLVQSYAQTGHSIYVAEKFKA